MPTPRHDPPTSIRIPVDLKRELQRTAAKEERTLTFVVVNILRQWVAWKGKKQK